MEVRNDAWMQQGTDRGLAHQVEPLLVADGRLSCSISSMSMGGALACRTSMNILTANPTIASPIRATTAFMRLSQNLRTCNLIYFGTADQPGMPMPCQLCAFWVDRRM